MSSAALKLKLIATIGIKRGLNEENSSYPLF